MQNRFFRIAGVLVKIAGPSDIINQAFELFEVSEPEDEDDYIEWEVCEDVAPEIPEGGERITVDGFDIMKNEDSMFVFYTDEQASRIDLIKYEENMQKATFYIPHFAGEHDWEYYYRARQSFFEATLDAFCVAMLKRGGISIHSSSISYVGNGIVFASKSHDTKVDHARLWSSKYGAEVLDGDVAMCRVVLGKLKVYGLPWAGRSGTRLNKEVPLAALIFINNSDENSVTTMTREDATNRLVKESLSPGWFKDIEKERYIVAKRIVQAILGCVELNCYSLIESINMLKEKIDSVLSR